MSTRKLLTALFLAAIALSPVARAHAGDSIIVVCQRKLLMADVKRMKCQAACDKKDPQHFLSTCHPKCEARFQSAIVDPLTCLGPNRIVRHVVVPANGGPFTATGVYTPFNGSVSIVATGKWSYGPGSPKVGPEGRPGTEFTYQALVREAKLGELITYNSRPAPASGSFSPSRLVFTSYTNVPESEINLAMNDVFLQEFDNEGSLVASVMVEGATRVRLAVDARQWRDTGIFLSPGAPLAIFASGLWSNAGPPSLGPAGYVGYRYPGTILPNADLGTLAGRVWGNSFPIGGGIQYMPYPGTGPLQLGMNDVAQTFGDNQGVLMVDVYNRSWLVN